MNFFKCTVNFFKQFPEKSHIQTTVVSNRGNTSFLLYNLNSVTNIPGRSHFNPAVKNYHAVSHTGQIPSSLTRAGAGSFSTCWELSQCQSCDPEGCTCCMQRCRGSTHPLHCTALGQLSQHTGTQHYLGSTELQKWKLTAWKCKWHCRLVEEHDIPLTAV